jgi:hypothetical protein
MILGGHLVGYLTDMRIIVGGVPNEERAKARFVCDHGIKLMIPPCETVLEVGQAGSDRGLNFLTGFFEFVSGIEYAHGMIFRNGFQKLDGQFFPVLGER